MRDLIADFRRALSPHRRAMAAKGIDVDDLEQAALLKVWRARGEQPFADHDEQMRHVYTVAKSVRIDEIRKVNRRSSRCVAITAEMQDDAPSPEDRLWEKRTNEIVAKNIGRLVSHGPYEAPPDMRAAMKRIAAGESAASVARSMGHATSTVTRWRDRLIDRMREEQRGPQLGLFG